MISTRGIVLACALVGAALPAGEHELFLDLTGPEVERVEGAVKMGCGGGGSLLSSNEGIILPPRPPLELEIISLDRRSYKLGDEVVCELRVTNASNNRVLFPWSVGRSVILGNDCEWLAKAPGEVGLTATLGLSLMDAAGYGELTAAHGLYGISTKPASYRALGPHESMRVRMGGHADLYYLSAQRQKAGLAFSLPQDFTAVAFLEWDDSPTFGKYAQVRSHNHLQLTIAPK